ncbi:MAG: hypothetical protein JWL77_4819 [Chthonomonadaceae bacterium]|nr:hypothetical protein [Chthonomonadaceae bacterium]
MKQMHEDRTEETLETALAALKQEAQGAKGRVAASVGAWALSLLLAILGVGWLTAGRSTGLVPLALALLCLFLGALISPQPHHRTIDALLPVADVRAIGPLLDLLPSAFAGRKKAILTVLTQLLPQLQADEVRLLQPSHRSQMRNALLFGDLRHEHEYLIAVLKALEQIGDNEDLVCVTRLAIGQSESWQERQVREAARACLPPLREHVDQEKQRGLLLRPAFAVAPEELLHPAIHTPDPDPAHLLRADTETNQRDKSSST